MRGIVIFSLLVIGVIGCAQGPSAEFVGRSASETSGLFADYAVHVKCDVLNSGKTGDITVAGSVDARNGNWTKTKTLAVSEGANRSFTFDFPEVENALFGDNSYTYNCLFK